MKDEGSSLFFQHGMAKHRDNSSEMLRPAVKIGNWQSQIGNVL